MVLKCYPCIRGCGYVKGVLGAVLVALTAFLTSRQDEIMNCPAMGSHCQLTLGVLIDQTADRPNLHLTRAVQVQDYCDCLQGCINYMGVFHLQGMAADEHNCFRKSSVVGLTGIATAGNAKKATSKTIDMLPTLGSKQCMRCSDAAETQSQFITTLTWLVTLSGLAMFATAGCEHVELKFHNAYFSIGVLVLDVLCGILLIVATSVSIEGAKIAHDSCDPTNYSAALKQAGLDSISDEENKAAVFTDFLGLLMQPLAKEVCHQFRKFTVCALVCLLSGMANLWSFFATVFLCLGCTDDGLDDHSDDDKAADLHALMNCN